MGFSRQEYWSGLPFPSPGDLPDPGIKPGSPALRGDALPSELPSLCSFKNFPLKIFMKKSGSVSCSCLTLCWPHNCSPPGFSVLGILQARILEWVAIPFCRRSSQPSAQTQVSCIAGRCFTMWATFIYLCNCLCLVQGVVSVLSFRKR